MPPTGDMAHNLGMCPDWESNWQPFGLQAHTQSSELHQPRLGHFILNSVIKGEPTTECVWEKVSLAAFQKLDLGK